MVECVWEDRGQKHLKSPVSLGDHFNISRGFWKLLTILAQSDLQGPVTYEVESAAGGYLSVGKLTARLEKEHKELPSQAYGEGLGVRVVESERRSPSVAPLFTIKTPTAIVTDLGTEFGVEVSKDGGTVSHVFRGSVRVQMIGKSGQVREEARVLHANESAQIPPRADASSDKTRKSSSLLQQRWPRRISSGNYPPNKPSNA